MLLSDKDVITVAARGSELSRAQVTEVERLMHSRGFAVLFHPTWIETRGDKDLITSLRQMDKSDFFTKEIDEMLLTRQCRVAIHSAKDLPDPMAEGLVIAALTEGVDSADVLVMKEGMSVATLPFGARVATSSERRQEMMRSLRSDFVSCDVRGTIGARLRLLDEGCFEGLIMAEAALIRLGLTHLNRVRLEGPTAAYQGRLAVVTLETDDEMRGLFACIDTR